MKTAISIPDELFDRLDAHARERGESRSGLVAEAVRAYLRKLEDEEITRRFNEAYSDPELVAESLALAAEGKRAFARILERDPW